MRSLGGPEVVILLLVVLLLFGAKRLPEAARGLGKALRILKSEAQGASDEQPRSSAPGDDSQRS